MKDYKKLVWLLFLAVVVIRIALAFSSPYFDYDSYFHIRQIESIKETGLPVFNDTLSYGGGFFIFSPVFHYIMAFFSFLIPISIVGKIIPNIAFALLIPLAYYIAKEITGKQRLALIAPVVVAFMPVLWSSVFSVDPISFAIPAIFAAFYFLSKEEGKSNIHKFLFFITLACFLSPLTIFAIPIIWIYILFLKIEKEKIEETLLESAAFSTFLILLVQFIFYKNSILINGANIIWQNIPAQLIQNYFTNIGVLDIIAYIGILPFIFGLYEIYIFSFEKKERAASLFIGLAIFTGFLMWLKLIQLQTGMILLGMGISVIFCDSIRHFMDYFQKIRFNKVRLVMIAIIVIFLFSASIPAFSYFLEAKKNIPNQDEMKAFLWLEENGGSPIIAAVNDGFAINAISKKSNVIDRNFLMTPYAEERLRDVSLFYSTNFETQAMEVLDKYHAKYIFFGKNVKKEFNATELGFQDKKCFAKFFESNDIKIYKTWCNME